MRRTLLPLLVCPECRRGLSPEAATEESGEIVSGTLRCAEGHAFPIKDSIPRFVPSENYAESFGFQWNRFARTQLDTEGGKLSEERFFTQTRWPRELRGELIVEAGAGAGRFTPHAASTGATVISLDYSNAIEAARRNNVHFENVHFLQADIRKLPLANALADRAFCFGVLQHTPDPDASFQALLPLLKTGGALAVDVYRLSWRCLLYGRYFLRPITKRVPPRQLFPLVHSYVKALYPTIGVLHKAIGPRALVLSSVLALSDYRSVWDLPPERLEELALLDTFDALSPAHDHPRTAGRVRRWFEQARCSRIELDERPGLVVGRGFMPS
jgi:SAM-dependent methyltransferase